LANNNINITLDNGLAGITKV